MALLNSLFSGVSGLRNLQSMMDVIGNNIANVDTIGYKSSRITFSDTFNQLIKAGTNPSGNAGGTNSFQVGLGMKVNSIDRNWNQGTFENTGITTDLALQGPGMFILKSNGQNYYSRAGAFSFDADGRLVSPQNGAVVQGKIADNNGVIPTGNDVQDIVINKNLKLPATATTTVKWGGNLNSTANQGDVVSGVVSVYDSLGNSHQVTLKFTKSAADNQWTWEASVPGSDTSSGSAATTTGQITFNQDGTLKSATMNPSGTPAFNFQPSGGADPVAINLDFGEAFNGITQTSASSVVTSLSQNGSPSASLSDLNVDQYGNIVGVFSNGKSRTLAQVMVATFPNLNGLISKGDNMYSAYANAGTPKYGEMGADTATTVQSGALEQSNVDLSEEFTKMIVSQRGFQANARVVTTADSLLQEITSLVR